ncbi:MAG TPA: hypothetical protein VIV65_06990, partial [Gemmatimonadaceae bacterium]
MADFSQSQRLGIQKSFDRSQEWIEKLLKANEQRESDIRGKVLDELGELTDKLALSGFLDRTDFTPAEQESIAAVAVSIDETSESVRDSNDTVLMELGSDLAELVSTL